MIFILQHLVSHGISLLKLSLSKLKVWTCWPVLLPGALYAAGAGRPSNNILQYRFKLLAHCLLYITSIVRQSVFWFVYSKEKEPASVSWCKKESKKSLNKYM
ncbi:hypothetical protein L9F63_009085, partial [Diploptera punctata]